MKSHNFNCLFGRFTSAALVGLLLLVLASVLFYAKGSPISDSKLRRLSAGMTTNEVIAILGRPSSARMTPGEMFYMSYNVPCHWQVLMVTFDERGRYKGNYLD